MHRDHKFRACLFHCLRKENLFHFGIRLCDTRDAEEQDIRLNTVQLPFDVIETGADQNLPVSVFNEKVIGPALFVFSQAGRLLQRFGNRLPEVIIQYGRLRVEGCQNAYFIFTNRIAASVSEYDDTILRKSASKRDIPCGFASVDLRAASSGDIGRVHYMIVMRVGNKDSPKPADLVEPDQLITQSFICFFFRPSGIFDEGWSGNMGIEKNLVFTVIKQECRRSKIGYFEHGVSSSFP